MTYDQFPLKHLLHKTQHQEIDQQVLALQHYLLFLIHPQTLIYVYKKVKKNQYYYLFVHQEMLIKMLTSGSIGNTTGYSEYMRAFARQSMHGLWLTGFDISGNNLQMSIRGGLLNPELLPNFIKRLNQEKIMRGKEFASLQMLQHKVDAAKSAGRSYLEFTLISGDVEEKDKDKGEVP